ncbi:phospholipid-translocating P-type ATPase [Fomitiporia mediterranea MF3/22]|uniref:phospholipid-translocating P-type ATPase n=1 Tax=Fomitiporia mediterranea (strain MF3/22) TaxID=694068 RepID=UPI00044072A2|nr:phospholipid-translocating P-type ATPase [Fomitiporia mediterranea MF3/22]EJD02206.1 phospholipid-translocating P-type ATPase [Fomitiporia mediterranea MF3/22]
MVAKARPRRRNGGAHRLVAWYDKLAAFNVESLFAKSKQVGPPRTVFINEDLPQDYFDQKGRIKKEHVYKTNQVVTSKYTIVTFLPRNLLEQFRRIANMCVSFFAFIAILQFFHQFSTISPGLVILPLLIVLAITGVKDGYEDVKRHQSDRQVNQSHIRVLSGGAWNNPNVTQAKSRTFSQVIQKLGLDKKSKRKKAGQQGAPPEVELVERGGVPGVDHAAPANEDPELHDIEFDHDHEPRSPTLASRPSYDIRSPSQELHRRSIHAPHFGRKRDTSAPHWRRTAWENVRVGDFVKIVNEEAFPADILICATSEDENVCFVETKNLDGETNLKSRNAVPALTQLRTADACVDPSLARFRIELDRPEPNMYKLNGAVEKDGQKQPIDLQTVLLRGTVLKNTKWVIGVVMFTGEDTKIVLNAGGTPSKRSRVERQMNPQVFFNLLLLAGMAVACGIVDHILEARYFGTGAPWLVGDNHSDDNPNINGLITAIFALITFQNIVPISLYISIEAVRTVQAAFIYFDKDIWYSKTDQPTLARSWNLSDDLGQIEYVFSDKTGTLTQNVMVFRNCSIGGRVYRGEGVSETSEGFADAKNDQVVDIRLSATASADESSRPGSSNQLPAEKRSVDKSPTRVPIDPIEAPGVELSTGVANHFHNNELAQDLADAIHADENSENAGHARTLNGFFSVLALCHTVIASVEPETGRISYRAQSPDEAALVQAAADAGFVFRGRDKEILRLQTPFSEELELYELLNVLDFTSARKRMSVIVRKLNEDNRLFLLTKGADNVIFERLKPGINDELKEITGHHLDEFASEGLRTLTLAYKVISDEYYEEWAEKYQEATVALDNREDKVAEICEEIETDLRLLGATAIEDRLQDGVPETIADLKLAGIKVWVLTGDKLETAIAIGYSTNLIAPESNLIVIRGDVEDGLSIFDQMYNAAEEFFPEAHIIEEEALDINEKHGFEVKGGEMNGFGMPLRRVNTGVSSIVGTNNGDRPGGFILVIEGSALTHAFADDDSKRLLLRLSIQCEAVICCRVSPLQKALVVKMIKEGIGAMTLAIGDGANDVSMIQAADVGVGISGEEGLQAVNSSDYAIAQFRFLKRLLLVHGHWSYARNGNMIVNFFYKNIICIGCLWWFMIYCGWSSQYVFEYTYLLFWNVFWSLCPVIAIGLFDRIADDDILMEIPELYRYGREGYWFGHKTFLIYMFDAVLQSAIIFFLITYSYFMPTARPDGFDVAQYEFATTMVLSAVMVANMYNGLNTAAWTGWVFFALFIGIVLVWAYTAIYSIISPGWFYVPVYGNDHYLFHSAIFWLSIPLVFFLSLVPRYLARAYRFNINPTEIDKLRWVRKLDPSRKTREQLLGEPPKAKKSKLQGLAALAGSRPSLVDRRGSRTDMATGLRGVHRGFDFAQEEGGVAIQRIQTNLSERRLQQLDERKKQGKDRKNSRSRLRLFSLSRGSRRGKRSGLSGEVSESSHHQQRPPSSES